MEPRSSSRHLTETARQLAGRRLEAPARLRRNTAPRPHGRQHCARGVSEDVSGLAPTPAATPWFRPVCGRDVTRSAVEAQ